MSKGEKVMQVDQVNNDKQELVQGCFRVAINAKGGDCWIVGSDQVD